MAIGLSRKSNLSEKNLNLSEAIQKLYAPGIQDDIELFSLSSQIKSFIISGEEADEKCQIVGLRSEVFQEADGTSVDRTKFITKDLTYSTGDSVYFDNFGFEKSLADKAVNPIFSKNGSVPAIKIIYSGRGYYFKKTGVNSNLIQEFNSEVTLNNVVIRGKSSGSDSARATVKFKIDQDTQYTLSTVSTWKVIGGDTIYNAGDTANGILNTTNTLTINADGSWTYTSPNETIIPTDVSVELTYSNGIKATYLAVLPNFTGTDSSGSLPLAPVGAPNYLTKWTGFYTLRFYVDSLVITNPGKNYIIGEDLEIVEGTVVTDNDSGVSCLIIRQEGEEYFGRDPIIISDNYYYRVTGASQSGFYLVDPVVNKYVYLDFEKDIDDLSSEDPRELRIIRDDFILIDNILQLKFVQSRAYIYSYGDGFRIGDTITGEVYGLSNTARKLRSESYRAIQNTKRPTSVTSDDNILGFEYNKITGQNMDIWQRFIIRDQDYVLGTSGVDGIKLKFNVDNFALTDPAIRVPGLFLKVGNEYKRAFSTTDKPYYQVNPIGDGVLNPNVNGEAPDYSLYAANRNATSWYGYNTSISKLGQRLHSNGKDGAFYFHRSQAPAITTKTSGGVTYYEVPLFTFVP